MWAIAVLPPNLRNSPTNADGGSGGCRISGPVKIKTRSQGFMACLWRDTTVCELDCVTGRIWVRNKSIVGQTASSKVWGKKCLHAMADGLGTPGRYFEIASSMPKSVGEKGFQLFKSSSASWGGGGRMGCFFR